MRVLFVSHHARQQASSSHESWSETQQKHDSTHALVITRNVYLLIRSQSFSPDIVSYVYFSYVHQNWIRTFPTEVGKYISFTNRSRAIIIRRHTVPISHAWLLLKAQHTPWLVQQCSNNHFTTLSKHPQTLPMIRSLKRQNSAPCRAFVR